MEQKTPSMSLLPSDSPPAFLDDLAQKIVSRRLGAPAAFFLEIHLPVLTLAHSSTLLFGPLLTPFFGAERLSNLSQLLSDRKHVEDLLRLIEHHEDLRCAADAGPKR